MTDTQPAVSALRPIENLAFLPHFCQPLRSDPTVIVGLDPLFMNPGFLTSTGVKKANQLQGFVDSFLGRKRNLSRLRFALVDLSKKDLSPDFAGHRETEQGGLGSMAKIAVMYGVFQLKFDLEVFAKRMSLNSQRTLFNAARAIWAKTQIEDAKAPGKELHPAKPKIELRDKLVKSDGEAFPIKLLKNAAAPKLENIFEVTSGGAGALTIKILGSDRIQVDQPAPHTNAAVERYVHFTPDNASEARKLTFAERMFLMIDESDNVATNTCIDDLGLLYIASSLWQSGIYDPNRGGGLWAGSGFDGHLHWHKSFAPQNADFTNSTAASVAAYFTLMAQNQLINPGSSAAIKHLLSKRKTGLTSKQGFPTGSYTRSFFEEGLRHDGIKPDPINVFSRTGRRFSLQEVHSKLGIGNFSNDCLLVVREERGIELKYVATGFDDPKLATPTLLWDLIVELDMCIQQNNGLAPKSAP